jgi:hypothetical protein
MKEDKETKKYTKDREENSIKAAKDNTSIVI